MPPLPAAVRAQAWQPHWEAFCVELERVGLDAQPFVYSKRIRQAFERALAAVAGAAPATLTVEEVAAARHFLETGTGTKAVRALLARLTKE